ncbi:hypothetical protein C0991_001455 [Blastosporella zonata]|nr:hypothetical protein C0991_001455 [Blastosporella zonata]
MKSTAAIADSFVALLKDASFEDGKKSRKRKGAADDDDDKPAKRKRKAKDPNAPKRPASSYIMFQNDIRKELKEKNPTLSNPDLLAMISDKWSKMTDDEKAVYNKAVSSAKELYAEEKKAYDARTPEEVAAANAANEAAIAPLSELPTNLISQLKKAQPRTRAPKAAAAAAATPVTAPAESSPSVHSDSEESDSSEEDVPKNSKALKGQAQQVEEDSEEEDSEAESSSEDEPPVKPPSKVKVSKAKPAPAPAPAKATKKKSAK